ncbi:MAG TPA: ShlB/FhaC/HecB family hemolysin secretion/activation protein [Stellaceae bacterium]|jgi:hemolysin activation/secretion protein
MTRGRVTPVTAIGKTGRTCGPLRRAAFSLALLLAAPGLAAPAFAQAVDLAPLISPPLPGVVPAPQPKIVPRPPAPAPTAAAPIAPGPALHIDAVRVEGVSVYRPAALAPLYAGVVGATVPKARLDAVVQNLQIKYRTDGYILSVVRGEVQRVNGRTVLVLRAVEGYISEVKLDGDIGPAGSLAYRYLEHLTWLRPLNNADLERYLLLVQDIPGVSVRAVLRHVSPLPGAVQLVAELSRKPISAYFQYDNLGSQVAGPNEMLASGATNSFTSFGEQLQGLFYDTFSREQIFGQVNASALLGGEGLKLWGYAGRGNSLPGGALAQADFNGDYTVGGLGLSYPAVRSRRLNLAVDGSFDTYDSTIDVTSNAAAAELNESHLRILRAGETFDFQDSAVADLAAANLVILRVSQGLPGLGASSNNAAFPARPGNRIDFTKVAGELTRVQNLATFGPVGTALKLSLAGQYTGDILPPSETFFFGGVRWGRGFYYGQITGDRALATTVELQANTGFTNVPIIAPGRRLDVQFYGFYDFGRAYNLAPGEFDQTLDSIGLGARSDVTPWLFVELAGVHRLTTQPNGANVSRLADYMLFSRVAIHN